MSTSTIAKRAVFLIELAKDNGVCLPLSDLLQLVPNGSADALESLKTELENSFDFSNGVVAPRSHALTLQPATHRRAEISKEKVRYVKRLVSSHPGLFGDALIVAVSGSASYMSASEDDDADLFLVIKDGKMWTTLFKLLTYIRAARVLGLADTDYCLSIILTANSFEELLKTRRDPLLARELLKLVPVKGERRLRNALATCKWISMYFPGVTYDGGYSEQGDVAKVSQANLAEKILFRLLSGYLSAVAKIRNFFYDARNQSEKVFEFIRDENFMTYESNRYKGLRELYGKAFKEAGSSGRDYAYNTE
ncbi:MAG: hypothetical protein QXI37_03425 [Thermoprotei archaeon]